MRVFVYYNLHKKLWSVKALEGPKKNKVIGHYPTVYLSNAEARVSLPGRARVLRDKCKNVHAGIRGELVHGWDEALSFVPINSRDVSYNPYFTDHFYYVDNKEKYTGSAQAFLTGKKVYTW